LYKLNFPFVNYTLEKLLLLIWNYGYVLYSQCAQKPFSFLWLCRKLFLREYLGWNAKRRARASWTTLAGSSNHMVPDIGPPKELQAPWCAGHCTENPCQFSLVQKKF